MLTTGESIYVVPKGPHPDGFVLRTINDHYTKYLGRTELKGTYQQYLFILGRGNSMRKSDCKPGTSVVYRGIIIHNISGFIIKSPYYLEEYDKINLYVTIMTVWGNDVAVKIKQLEKL